VLDDGLTLGALQLTAELDAELDDELDEELGDELDEEIPELLALSPPPLQRDAPQLAEERPE